MDFILVQLDPRLRGGPHYVIVHMGVNSPTGKRLFNRFENKLPSHAV